MSSEEFTFRSQRLRTGGAADYVGSTKSTLEKRRLTGGGPAYIKLGRTVVYDTRDLDQWLASRRRRSTSDPGPEAA
jgi:predicted DNA-binding transcriptional regulator AlpA